VAGNFHDTSLVYPNLTMEARQESIIIYTAAALIPLLDTAKRPSVPRLHLPEKKMHNLANVTPITRARGHVVTHQNKKIFSIRP